MDISAIPVGTPLIPAIMLLIPFAVLVLLLFVLICVPDPAKKIPVKVLAMIIVLSTGSFAVGASMTHAHQLGIAETMETSLRETYGIEVSKETAKDIGHFVASGPEEEKEAKLIGTKDGEEKRFLAKVSDGKLHLQEQTSEPIYTDVAPTGALIDAPIR